MTLPTCQKLSASFPWLPSLCPLSWVFSHLLGPPSQPLQVHPHFHSHNLWVCLTAPSWGTFLFSQPQPCDHLSLDNFPSSCASKPRPIQHLPPGSQRSFKLNTSKVELAFFMTPSTASYPHSPSTPSQFTFGFPHVSEKPLPVFMKTSEVILTLTLHPLHSHTSL